MGRGTPASAKGYIPFDLTSDEKIVRWRAEAHDYGRKAKWANSDHERDAYLTIASSYDNRIKSEEQMMAQRNRGVIPYLRGKP